VTIFIVLVTHCTAIKVVAVGSVSTITGNSVEVLQVAAAIIVHVLPTMIGIGILYCVKRVTTVAVVGVDSVDVVVIVSLCVATKTKTVVNRNHVIAIVHWISGRVDRITGRTVD